jgi:hypothetical protein
MAVVTKDEFAANLLALGKLEAQEKFYDEYLDELKRQATNFPADLQKALAEVVETMAANKRLRARGPRGKTKLGRPGIWKSYEGRNLIRVVEKIRASKHCSIAHAIRRAIKNDPALKDNKAICRLKDNALQVRYQEAVKYWSFLSGSYLEEQDAMNARISAATEGLRAAIDRWKASLPGGESHPRTLRNKI